MLLSTENFSQKCYKFVILFQYSVAKHREKAIYHQNAVDSAPHYHYRSQGQHSWVEIKKNFQNAFSPDALLYYQCRLNFRISHEKTSLFYHWYLCKNQSFQGQYSWVKLQKSSDFFILWTKYTDLCQSLDVPVKAGAS